MKNGNFLKSAYLLVVVTLLIFLPLSFFIVLELLKGMFGYGDTNIFLKEHGSLLAGLLALLAAIGAIWFQNWNTTRQIQASQYTSEKNRFNDKKEALYKILLGLEDELLNLVKMMPQNLMYGGIDARNDNSYFYDAHLRLKGLKREMQILLYQYDFIPIEMEDRYLGHIDLYLELLITKYNGYVDLVAFIRTLKVYDLPVVYTIVQEMDALINKGGSHLNHNSIIKGFLEDLNVGFRGFHADMTDTVVSGEYGFEENNQ